MAKIDTLQKTLEDTIKGKKEALKAIDDKIDALSVEYGKIKDAWDKRISDIENEIDEVVKAEKQKELDRKAKIKEENEKAYNEAYEAFKKAQKDYFDKKKEYTETSDKKYVMHDNDTGLDFDFTDLKNLLDIFF